VLVDGDLELWHDSSLDEGALGVNFNPPGTLYEDKENTNMVDVYPNLLAGLCYISGASSVPGDVSIDGVLVVGGQLTSSNSLSVAHDATLVNYPPPGFERSYRPMAVDEGTWRQVVD